MRTAKDLIASIWQAPNDDLQMYVTLNPDISLIEQAIHIARKEAIEECAERANADYLFSEFDDKVVLETIKVDKQSILSIIDELK